MDGGLASLLVAGGSASISVASLLWALRVTDGARGALRKWRERAGELEEKLARTDSIFAAHPGVVLIWEEGAPEQLFGNPQSPRLQRFLKGSLK